MANDQDRINRYFFNRPSRIRYNFYYGALGYEVYSEIINQHFEPDFAAQLTGKLATINNLSFDIIQEIINEAKAFPDLSVTELFEGFNLDRLDLDLGYADFKVMLKNPETGKFDLSLADYIISALGMLPYKLPKATISGALSRKMTLEGIYNGEFNDRAEPFRVTLTLGGENNSDWVNASRTRVEKIDHKEVHLLVDTDLSSSLPDFMANTVHAVIDYEQYGEDYEYNDMY